MKRIVFLFVILLLTVALFAGAVAESVIIPAQRIAEDGLPFTRAEALARAEQLLEEHDGTYSADQYREKAGSVLLPDGRSAWIAFLERKVDEPIGNLYVVLSAQDGEVIEVYYPDNDVYTWIMLEWDSILNKHRSDWDVEQQALFDWLFSDDEEMFEPSLAAVSREKAVELASAWLTKTFGTEYDSTDVSYMGIRDENGALVYSWSVSFCKDGAQVFLVFVNTETGEIENSFDLSEGNG